MSLTPRGLLPSRFYSLPALSVMGRVQFVSGGSVLRHRLYGSGGP